MESLARDVGRLGPDLYNGVDKGSTAFKMLASMGWKEGQGLGASEQGIKEHLKVKKKFDTLGMGAAEQVDRSRDWTTGMWTYDRVLSGLKEITAVHPPSSDSGSESDDDSSGSAAPVRRNPRLPAPKAAPVNGKTAASKAAPANGKTAALKAAPVSGKVVAAKAPASSAKASKPAPGSSSDDSDSSDSSSDSDSDSSSESGSSSSSDSGSESDEPAKPQPKVAAVAANRVQAARHAGRYQKRERAKMVKGYSANDLAAILGAAPAPASGPGSRGIIAGKAPTPSSSEASSEASSSEAESESDDDVPAAKKAKGQVAKPDKVPGSASAESPGPKAWWVNLFVRAGRIGGTSKPKKEKKAARKIGLDDVAPPDESKRIRVTGFREQDQENLYMSAHNNATHAKQGLGIASAPKKVAGAHWAGTKTKIGSDTDSDSDSSSADIGEDSSEEVGCGDDEEEMGASTGKQIVILAAKAKQSPVPLPAPVVAAKLVAVKPQQVVKETKAAGGKRKVAASKPEVVEAALPSKKQKKQKASK